MLSPTRTLRNFVDGEYRDARPTTSTPLINPATGEEFARAPISSAADVDAALQAAQRAFGGWRDTTPRERSIALLRIADAFEKRAEEFVALECENTGKPIGMTRSEEIPQLIDPVRFFAGCARILEGTSAGEYMAGHTSMIRREPVGVCAQVTPVELPDAHGDLEVGARDRRGQHGRPQAVGHHAGDHAAHGRDHGRVPAAGRLQRGLRRPDHRRRAGDQPDPRDGVDHRQRPRRASRSPGLRPATSSASTSSSAARRR